MGEEDRSSSGSSTVMIVIAILGGIMLVGCCGGVLVISGIFMVEKQARSMQQESFREINAQEQIQQELEQAREEMKKTSEEFEKDSKELRQDIEGIKIPGDRRSEVFPAPVAPPAAALPDEAEK